MIVPKSLLGSSSSPSLEKSLLKRRTTTSLSAIQLQNLWRKANFEILLNLICLYCHLNPFSGSRPPSPFLSNLCPASWVERELLRHLPGGACLLKATDFIWSLLQSTVRSAVSRKAGMNLKGKCDHRKHLKINTVHVKSKTRNRVRNKTMVA